MYNFSVENPFDHALQQLSRATKVKSFNPDLLLRLSAPEREARVNIPVQMDDGSLHIFEGYRVQHCSLRGPYKGGVRYHPAADINEVRALAFWMTLKTAVVNIPMGGGKGGITVDPKTLTKNELGRLTEGWVKGLLPLLGPLRDIPAPDVGTTPEIIGYMNDAYASLTGDSSGAAFTGKPLEKGGSEGRSAATGLGGFYTFDELINNFSLPPTATVAIQGMGNVGWHAAEIFTAHGYKVVAISDSRGGLYKTEGLDLKDIETYKKERGSLMGYAKAEPMSNEALLELAVDILIPAALENQITAHNANNIKAKVVLELANGPTTPEADDILHERGITVIPDILANAGGVIVSTFEWEQNRKSERWSEEEVNKKLQTILATEAAHVYATAQKYKTDLRRAAFIVSLERLEEAYVRTLRK